MEPDLQTFVRASIKSIWALELLLRLRSRAPEAVAVDDLVRDLRATRLLVTTCVEQIGAAGLAVCEDGMCRYAPASPAIDALCAQLEAVYRERPLSVIDAILTAPNERLKSFADAFRIGGKGDKP